jgi:hypothetical protein
MTRRVLFLLVPLLAVALVGFAKGQSAVEHAGDAGANPQHSKAEVPYLPCEDPIFSAWEYGGVGGDPGKNPQLSKAEVLDLRAHMNKGLWEHDPAQTAPCIADGYTKIDERFGIGYVENNATRRLKDATRMPGGGGGHLDVVQFEHYIHLYVFGDHNDTVVLTDFSKSALRFEGKMSYGPRLNASVFVRQHGRWLMVANQTSDIPKGNAPWNTW